MGGDRGIFIPWKPDPSDHSIWNTSVSDVYLLMTCLFSLFIPRFLAAMGKAQSNSSLQYWLLNVQHSLSQ